MPKLNIRNFRESNIFGIITDFGMTMEQMKTDEQKIALALVVNIIVAVMVSGQAIISLKVSIIF